MIFGIGADIVDIERVQQGLARYGDRYARRILTKTEMEEFTANGQRASFLAKRFAAKEAVSKALGTGFRRGVFWRDMGVINLPSGKPTMALTGGALARLEEITPPGMQAQIDVTLTDEPPLAEAVVIISAIPK